MVLLRVGLAQPSQMVDALFAAKHAELSKCIFEGGVFKKRIYLTSAAGSHETLH